MATYNYLQFQHHKDGTIHLSLQACAAQDKAHSYIQYDAGVEAAYELLQYVRVKPDVYLVDEDEMAFLRDEFPSLFSSDEQMRVEDCTVRYDKEHDALFIYQGSHTEVGLYFTRKQFESIHAFFQAKRG